MQKRTLALVTLLAFGCATVRVPVTAPEGVAAGVAEPDVELWLESGEAVGPAEQTQAWSEAHRALAEALAHRHISSDALGAGDAVLAVRERAVARTSSRRRDQTAAIVGMVVGIVVVVAVVAVILVSTKGSGGKSVAAPTAAPVVVKAPAAAAGSAAAKAVPGAANTASAAAAKAGPAARNASGALAGPPTAHATAAAAGAAAVPHAGPAGPLVPRVASATPGWAPPYRYYEPAPRFYFDPWLELRFDLWSAQERPVVLAPPEPAEEEPGVYQSPEALALGERAPPPPPDGTAPAPEETQPALVPAQPEPPPQLRLPPPPDYPLQQRGFFAGDDTLLELNLLDRTTGELLWSKTVQAGSDPRDVRDLDRLLDEAFEGQRWAQAVR